MVVYFVMVACVFALGCADISSEGDGEPVAQESSAVLSLSGAELNDIESFNAPSGQFTVVPFVNPTGPYANAYDTQTHRFGKMGVYGQFRVCAALTAWGSTFEVYVFVNGVQENLIASSKLGAARGCRTVSVSYNGTFDLRVWQATGQPIVFSPLSVMNWMTVELGTVTLAASDVNQFTAQPLQFVKVPYVSADNDNKERRWDNVENKFVSLVDQRVRVCASLSSRSYDYELDLFINGQRERAFAISKNGVASGCRTVMLAANTSVDIRLYHMGANAMTISPDAVRNQLTFSVIGGTGGGLSMGNTSAFTVPSGQSTAIPFTTVLENTAGFVQNGTAFTATKVGNYNICASVASFAQDFLLDLYINGVRDRNFAVSSFGMGQGCRSVTLNVNDRFEVVVQQSSGNPMPVSTNRFWNWLVVSS
jgi:hypothetical protein